MLFRTKKKTAQKFRSGPRPPFRLGVAMLVFCVSLSMMQPREAHAQVDPVAAANFIIQHAWEIAAQAATFAFQHAENLISWMVVSSGLSGVIGGMEIQVEAANRQTQAKLDHEKLMHSADPAAQAAAKAAPSPTAIACPSQYGGYTRNGSGNAVGGLVKMVTGVVMSKGRPTGSTNGSTTTTPPDEASVANQTRVACQEVTGQGYSFYQVNPCQQQ